MKFIKATSGRYLVFNNEAEDPNQVELLFDQLDQLLIMNGGEYYTNEMLQAAELAIEEEKRRLMLKERLSEEEARSCHDSTVMSWLFLSCGGVVT